MTRLQKTVRALAHLEITLLALATLMGLVVLCTLAQVHIGTFEAVDRYIRTFFIMTDIPGLSWRVPLFPGGGLVGGVLLINLFANILTRFRFNKKKLGIWIIHAGLILLVAGEFTTAFFARETQMVIEEGQSVNYTEDTRRVELAVIDTSPTDHDRVVSIPPSRLGGGETIAHPELPLTLRIIQYFPNAMITQRQGLDPGDLADQGLGTRLSIVPQGVIYTDDRPNTPAAYVEVIKGEQSLGTWLLSADLRHSEAVTIEGKEYRLALRFERHYLPYRVFLKDFTHDVYPGTDIPKNFSSLVQLTNPDTGEDREVLIYMNHPLRYEGLTYYQASFGKNDTLSVLQVVQNPGWLLPYVSCTLMALGMLLQFLVHLLAYLKKKRVS